MTPLDALAVAFGSFWTDFTWLTQYKCVSSLFFKRRFSGHESGESKKKTYLKHNRFWLLIFSKLKTIPYPPILLHFLTHSFTHFLKEIVFDNKWVKWEGHGRAVVLKRSPARFLMHIMRERSGPSSGYQITKFFWRRYYPTDWIETWLIWKQFGNHILDIICMKVKEHVNAYTAPRKS